MILRKVLIATGVSVALTANAFGSAKAPLQDPGTTAPQVKRVVEFQPIANVAIDLPPSGLNGSVLASPAPYDFGPDLLASLRTQMNATNQYVVQVPSLPTVAANAEVAQASPTPNPSNYQWDGSQLAPSATFTFSVDALVFRSGGRGDSMFYGFDERFKTPFNDGTGKLNEEFPLTLVDFEPNHFDTTFNDRGTAPFDSVGGLDLGEGFQLDALVAWIDVKYAAYHSEIRMKVQMDAPLAGIHQVKEVGVTGYGYFYDIVAGYESFSGGLGLDRSDAMSNAFKNAFSASNTVLNEWVQALPLTALVFTVTPQNEILLNTGENSNIPVGTRYEIPDGSAVVEVTQSVPSGSIAKLDSGNIALLTQGTVLRQQLSTNPAMPAQNSAQARSLAALTSAAPTTPVTVDGANVAMPSTDLPKSNFASFSGLQLSTAQALLDSVVGGLLLPYRIWRYFEYDQAYGGNSQGNYVQTDSGYTDSTTPNPGGSAVSSSGDSATGDGTVAQLGSVAWAQSQQSEAWAKQIGLDQATFSAPSNAGPIVAVIDSGVDYNNSAIKDSIWVNPSPFIDPMGHADDFGWDFISGDSRPYDDLYHGTEVTSALLSIAPQAQIMPLKVFNPWGVTSSAALYGAFQYAVDHGAKIILCAWATRLSTQTMQMAVQYAHDHGVLVVTAAGEGGYNLSKGEGNSTYPAYLSKSFDNVLSVAGVTTADQLVTTSGLYSNFDPGSVQIAAPGANVRVADPRGNSNHVTNTGVAAAMVAGQVVRNLSANAANPGTYEDWIKLILSQADTVSGLSSSVQNGLRLHVK